MKILIPSLSKAMLFFTPPQHEVYHRPFEAFLDNSNLTYAQEATNGGRNITAGSLVGVAGDIIYPSPTPQGIVGIENGLSGQGRYSVILEVVLDTIYGVEREIIQGYTDYAGVNPQTGSIDPNMKFYLNTIMRFSELQATGAYGTAPVRSMKSSNAVLTMMPDNPAAITMRPEDAVGWQQMQMHGLAHSNLLDSRSSLMGVAKLANVHHARPANYLADICNSYIRSTLEPKNEFDDSGVDYEQTLKHLAAGNLTTGSFYNAVRSVRFIGGTPEFCTFSDFDKIWHPPNNFWEIATPRPGTHLTNLMDNMEHWGGATLETGIAFSLTHVLPAIMSDFLLAKVTIFVTNNTPGNRPSIIIPHYVEIFPGLFNELKAQKMIGQLELDLCMGLLYNKAVLYELELQVNLFGNSYFKISLNGQPAVPYSAPMYCDSYYSPLLGLDNSNLHAISDSVEILTEHLTTDLRNPYKAAMITPNGLSNPDTPTGYGCSLL